MYYKQSNTNLMRYKFCKLILTKLDTNIYIINYNYCHFTYIFKKLKINNNS